VNDKSFLKLRSLDYELKLGIYHVPIANKEHK